MDLLRPVPVTLGLEVVVRPQDEARPGAEDPLVVSDEAACCDEEMHAESEIDRFR